MVWLGFGFWERYWGCANFWGGGSKGVGKCVVLLANCKYCLALRCGKLLDFVGVFGTGCVGEVAIPSLGSRAADCGNNYPPTCQKMAVYQHFRHNIKKLSKLRKPIKTVYNRHCKERKQLITVERF